MKIKWIKGTKFEIKKYKMFNPALERYLKIRRF